MSTRAEAMTGGPVLVVDDDPALRLAIQWALEDEGLSVETAADGYQALDASSRRRPAIVVLDMGLPVMGGVEVAAGLRRHHGSEIPILLITADGRAGEKARRVGAFDYLHKPFELDELVAAVHRAMGQESTG